MMNALSFEFSDYLVELIRSCGEYMLSAGDVEDEKGNIKAKSGDADFVTVFDEGVQQKLINGIKDKLPDAEFFAEEKDNFAEDTKKGICFVIDPIDGTTNFIHSLNASAISVAMLVDGEIVLGIIYDPYRDELFSAKKGKGAYCNAEKISVSSRSLGDSLISFGTTPYKKKEYAGKGFSVAENIFRNCADIRRSGSAAIDMANVACGRLDGFFECVLSPWDYAAGSLIVREAGGKVTDFDGNELTFSEPSSLLCSNNTVHDKLTALINK
ncbi:MAG: inositol monophosphatase [Ruminococcaceae bacterium]|nr:inositol monophosphatase [Oscillospiraceae bacterium]MBR3596332.1 inositol monophosphatase [Clostridia bacterium]